MKLRKAVVKINSSEVEEARFPQWVYISMLVLATVFWGSSYVFLKDVVEVFPPIQFVAIRFVLATAVLLIIFLKKFIKNFDLKTILPGCLLGLFLFGGYAFQTIGISQTTPGKNAFLTATYVVLVPFLIWAVYKRRPTRYHFISAIICLLGIGFISLNEAFTLSYGDVMTLVGAIFWGFLLVGTAKYSAKLDVVVLTIWEFLTTALLALALSLVIEEPLALQMFDRAMIGDTAFLVLIGTCLNFILMNLGQSHVDPMTSNLVLSLESVFGAFFSVIAGYEALTGRLVLGFLLVMIAVMLNEGAPRLRTKRRKSVKQG